MAMMRIGMGAAGETAVTGPPPPAPMGKLDQLVGGAKTWMSPGEIPDTLKAVFSPDAWKAAPMALIGFLLVPAAVLAVVLGMGAAKRRRAKNPRRKRAVARRSRRRAANPRRGRRRNAHLGWSIPYVVYPRGHGHESLAAANAEAKRISIEEGHATVENRTNNRVMSEFYAGKREPSARWRTANPRRGRRTAKKAYRIGTQSRMPAGSNIWDWLPSLDPHTTYATKAAAVKAAKRASLGKDVEGFKPRWTAHPVTGHAR